MKSRYLMTRYAPVLKVVFSKFSVVRIKLYSEIKRRLPGASDYIGSDLYHALKGEC